jgi:hypothetical protein
MSNHPVNTEKIIPKESIKTKLNRLYPLFRDHADQEYTKAAKEHYSSEDLERLITQLRVGKRGFFEDKNHKFTVIQKGVLCLADINTSVAQFVFYQYPFVESHITKIIQKFEGMECSSDKSQTVMRCIVKHYAFGESITLDYSGKCTIGLPKNILKTEKQICDYVDSLHYLYHGNSDKYLKNLLSITDSIKKQKLSKSV